MELSSAGVAIAHFKPARSQISWICQSSAADRPRLSRSVGSQFLDDAALDLYAFVQRLNRALDLGGGLGVASLDPRVDPGHVHLRADQDSAQLVVNVTRELRAFFLAHDLQVIRKLRKRRRSFLDQCFQPLGLEVRGATRHLPLVCVPARQDPNHQHQRDRQRRDDHHAHSGELDVPAPARVSFAQLHPLRCRYAFDLGADGVHRPPPDAGIHQAPTRSPHHPSDRAR